MRIPRELLQRGWFLAGPTACGKSAVALPLARQLNAEIVSLDSMSLYRGMDIGTAKPSALHRAQVPHHLIDVIEPHEEFSVAEYLSAAESACREIAGRGRVPLFVGGTGLYLRAVLRGVFEGPPADRALRQRLEAEAATSGPAELHRQLQQVDRAAAAVLHPNDARRVIRALEVYRLTGRPLSEQQRQPALPLEERPAHVYWLWPPREWLYERINRRVEEMFAAGLVDEVRGLLASDRPLSHTARQALGYKETIDHLEGRQTLKEAVEQVKTRTRQFAKRQHTWFRNLEECRAIVMSGREALDELAARILQAAGVTR